MNHVAEQGVDLSIAGPEGWQSAEGLLGSVIAYLAPSEDPSAFRPNFNVVVDQPDPPVGPEQLTAVHADGLLGMFDEPRLIDRGATTVAGLPASRVLLTYAEGLEDLTLEQWIVPLAGRNVVLSATCASLDYGRLAPEFLEVVSSVGFDA